MHKKSAKTGQNQFFEATEPSKTSLKQFSCQLPILGPKDWTKPEFKTLPIFTNLSSSFLWLVFLQHLLMVTSSSKSNNSKAKATCAPIKTGLLAKKAVAISMAQAKKNKEQSIKKFAGIGEYFFYQVVTCLMLNSNR